MKRFDGKSWQSATRILPEERAVAISVGGSNHAVMMASPNDLEDFAYGFLKSDGVIKNMSEIDDVTIVPSQLGVDIQVRLTPENAENYRAQRRAMVGPVGCGLCGIESLELAVPELKSVQSRPLPDEWPWRALQDLEDAQSARKISGAIHGCALLCAKGELVIVREDIGRHNAMDKVIGAAMRAEIETEQHILVTSSRVSLDLVIKAVRAGVGTLIARASPSTLALEYAEKWGLALIAPVFENEYFQMGEIDE